MTSYLLEVFVTSFETMIRVPKTLLTPSKRAAIFILSPKAVKFILLSLPMFPINTYRKINNEKGGNRERDREKRGRIEV